MGQTATKVANRIIGSSSSSSNSQAANKAFVPSLHNQLSQHSRTTGSTQQLPPPKVPKHIPSIPGKSGTTSLSSTIVIDPITGFTRGTAPLTPSEERQRQFLESRHNDMTKQPKLTSTTTTTTPVVSSSPPGTDTKMPDDLLKFLQDMGPVVRTQQSSHNHNHNHNHNNHSELDENYSMTQQQQQQQIMQNRVRTVASGPPRTSRMLSESEPSSTSTTTIQEQPVNVGIGSIGTDTAQSTTTGSSNNQKPGYDKTRVVSNMLLASNIPGYETSRTTSFSYQRDIIDPNDAPGYTMIQFFGLLLNNKNCIQSNKSNENTSLSLVPSTTTTTNVTSTVASIDNVETIFEHEQLKQNAVKYVQIPVLLKDTDGSYVGAYSEQVSMLLGAHRGMKLLDTTNNARLVLQELYEKDLLQQQQQLVAATQEQSDKEDTINYDDKRESIVTNQIDLGPSKAENAMR